MTEKSFLDDVWCEWCGCQMVLRRGKYGEFFGCTGYPRCVNIKKVKDVADQHDPPQDDIGPDPFQD